jgi:hypothetical protein
MRQKLYFGRRVSDSAAARFNGTLDEVTLYNRALEGELRTIYLAGSAGKAVPGANRPPQVYAGPDADLNSTSASVTLSGIISDDGLPLGQVTSQWSFVSGPGIPTFANAASASTTATFPADGLYLLRLTANDGISSASDIIEVRVNARQAPLPTGAVAWWRGNGTATDSVGGHDVTVLDATYVAGLAGQAFQVDGVGDAMLVEPPGAVDIGAGNGMTMEFWVKPDLLNNVPLFEWNTGTAFAAHTWMWTSASLLLNLVDTNGSSHSLTTAGNFFTAGQWVHVGIVYDRLAGRCRIYRNGTLSLDQVVGSFRVNTTTRLYFGRRISDGSPRYKGAYDEVTLYNRALTGAEISQIAAAGANGKWPGGDLEPGAGRLSRWRSPRPRLFHHPCRRGK